MSNYNFYKEISKVIGSVPNIIASECVEYTVDTTEEDITVSFSVPGCIKDNLNLTRNGNLLTLKITPDKENLFTQEGEVVIQLSININCENIESFLEHGVLNIVLPFYEKVTIPITE